MIESSTIYNNNTSYKELFSKSKIFFNNILGITILYINFTRFFSDSNKIHVLVLYILNRVSFLKLLSTEEVFIEINYKCVDIKIYFLKNYIYVKITQSCQ